uniref:Neuronal vesicle trafficking associated 1 n=1 Tax=Taeniopygia guttata TaxID=59729 RepID=B5G0Q9_TAEGU|nr:putative neuron specific gene family member 1 variant 1 [Taeniopygia guttata]
MSISSSSHLLIRLWSKQKQNMNLIARRESSVLLK